LVFGVETPGEGRGNRALGALLLRSSESAAWQLSPRVLRGLSNFYTPLFGPLLTQDPSEALLGLDLLANALADDRRAWDVLDLSPLPVNDPAFERLAERFRARNLVVQTYFCFGNWYLDVRGRAFTEYLSGLASGLRKNVPYAERKLRKTARVRFDLITTEEEIDRGLSAFQSVYAQSWRDTTELYPEFVPGLVREACRHGWLRLGVLYLDDEPAAAQFWLSCNRIASIFKICYAEKFSSLSVGNVLTAKMFEHALDVDKVVQIDYLSGDDAYKNAWMSDRRERWGMMIINPLTLRGFAQVVRHVGGRTLKGFLRRGLPRRSADRP